MRDLQVGDRVRVITDRWGNDHRGRPQLGQEGMVESLYETTVAVKFSDGGNGYYLEDLEVIDQSGPW